MPKTTPINFAPMQEEVITWKIENRANHKIAIPFVWPMGGSRFVTECDEYSLSSPHSCGPPEEANIYFRSHKATGWFRINVHDGLDIEMAAESININSHKPTGLTHHYTRPVQKIPGQPVDSVADLYKDWTTLDCLSMWTIVLNQPCTIQIHFFHEPPVFGSRLGQDIGLYLSSLKPKWWQFIKRIHYKKALAQAKAARREFKGRQ